MLGHYRHNRKSTLEKVVYLNASSNLNYSGREYNYHMDKFGVIWSLPWSRSMRSSQPDKRINMV